MLNRVCEPLEVGNSEPFYRHLKWLQNAAKPPMRLVNADNTDTDDPETCTNLLNNFFHEQFCPEDQLTPASPLSHCNQDTITITNDGVLKLICNLKSGKSPGPDLLKKEGLTIDPGMLAKCLASIEQHS